MRRLVLTCLLVIATAIAASSQSHHVPRYLAGGNAFAGFPNYTSGIVLLDASAPVTTLVTPGNNARSFMMDFDNRQVVFTADTWTQPTTIMRQGPQSGIYRYDPATGRVFTIAGPNTLQFFSPHGIHLNQDGDYVFGVFERVPVGPNAPFTSSILKLDRSGALTTILSSTALGYPTRFTSEIVRNIDTGNYLLSDSTVQTRPTTLYYTLFDVDDSGAFSTWGHGWDGAAGIPQELATGDIHVPAARNVYRLSRGGTRPSIVGTLNPAMYSLFRLDLQSAASPRWVGAAFVGNQQLIAYIDTTSHAVTSVQLLNGIEVPSFDFEFYRGRHLASARTAPRQWAWSVSVPHLAGRAYVLAFSATGVRPAVRLPDGRRIHLAFDAFVLASASGWIPPQILSNNTGRLDANGEARATFDVSSLSLPPGLLTWWQCVVLDPAAPNGVAYIPDPVTLRL